MHRDLKSANCLVRVDQSIVVIDFGLSRRLLDTRTEAEQRLVKQRFSTMSGAYHKKKERKREKEDLQEN